MHSYDFGRNPRKMYLLERNRLMSVLTAYPGRLLRRALPVVLLDRATPPRPRRRATGGPARRPPGGGGSCGTCRTSSGDVARCCVATLDALDHLLVTGLSARQVQAPPGLPLLDRAITALLAGRHGRGAPRVRTSAGSGAIVLAAYRPDPELFAVQLRSIRDQTRGDFRCLVGADGGQEAVRALVDEIVGDDPRFEVVGWDDNLGFYLNFERLLRAVPDDVAWVALSDQDDRWYPDKLERLVPLLDDAVLATGQARVVSWPGGDVVLERTRRRVVPAADLVFENQVTGAMSVFRRELLETALPFPRLHTVTQLHDHWLALCAVAVGSYTVSDDVVQDYVQHGANLVGETAAHAGWTPVSVVRRVVELADTYEGSHGPVACARACQVLGFGWRRLVLETLSARVPGLPADLGRIRARMSAFAPAGTTVGVLWTAYRSPNVTPSVVATFVPGVPFELYTRLAAGRKGSPPGSVDGPLTP